MAAFSTLIRGDLPPAGSPVILEKRKGQPFLPFSGYTSVAMESGTSALALAMILSRHRQPDITAPEVILPAYGCPDLVSAAVCAGVQPVLVDVESNSHCYDLAALAESVNRNTVAVVAVNFLGISERLSKIGELLKRYSGISLIEDNAQWFPEPLQGKKLTGDFVCLSFGRGKPVTMLGGGGLLIRDSEYAVNVDHYIEPASKSSPVFHLKLRLYNSLLHPFLYQFLSRNPWLKLGETKLKTLSCIRSMDMNAQALLAANLEAYICKERDRELAIRDIICGLENNHLIDLALEAGDRCGRLLRYPILCKDQLSRDTLLEAMLSAGLGASAMYKLPLIDIPGVAARVHSDGGCSGARDFATRLLTFPIHQGLDRSRLSRMRDLIHQQIN